MTRKSIASFSLVAGLLLALFVAFLARAGAAQSPAWSPLPVADDPTVRMPGTQPDQGVQLDGPGQCFNCHADYDPLTEPGNNWQGSMMAQAGRDFLYWATMTVAGQDAIWAVGNPNATDLCLRCHMPGGWLAGRSDPTNGSAMTGIDFDGVQCNLCHYLYDPFFETTYNGSREGSDWSGYWDETNASNDPSNTGALATYNQDSGLASAISLFNGQPFFDLNLPPLTYTENGGGQFFVSTLTDNRRASFADANANHNLEYSRYHKSKYFCSTCHDISNPVLHNLTSGFDPDQPLPSEVDPAYSYYHVERTFSEFMLSDFGLQGGAAGIGPFDPEHFETSQPNNAIASCQDCHMGDVPGKACDKNRAIDRPDGSIEHPNSGVPQHDLTGGNMWVSAVLASAVSGSANYDATNDALLNQGSAALTLDLTAGDVFDAAALLNGVDRAQQMLLNAAEIEEVHYDSGSGLLSFRVQNQTGHKLISGYPEGRRMFLNIRFFSGSTLLKEINPYDAAAGTLKGLTGYTYDDPDNVLPSPVSLDPDEVTIDQLVYEMHGSSTLTGEDESFHFVLGTDRYKDNRIPPMGFRISEAAGRLSEPVWQGSHDLNYYSAAEYAGGYDAVDLSDYGVTVPGADRIEIELLYQTTSREYIEFLRNEINDSGELTLTGTGAGGDPPYLIQSDPFFNQLRAWGDTIWELWRHNMNLPGAAPVRMAFVSENVSNGGNHPPLAVGDAYTTTEDMPLVVEAPGVLANDDDTDGDDLTAVLDGGPDFGQLNLELDGSFVYTPYLNIHGQDSFSYHAYDGNDDSSTVSVILTITSDNDAPIASGEAYTITEDGPLVVTAPGVLANDDDVDGDDLEAVLDTGPNHGALALQSDGAFVYTPTQDFNGQDSFHYHVYDGQDNSQTVVTTLNVTAENDLPVAADDGYTTSRNATLTVAAPGVLSNDEDPDGDTLSAILVDPPTSGALLLGSNGSLIYTPTTDFAGADLFTYYADDGAAASNTATVFLTVTAENSPPVAAGDHFTTTEDVPLNVAAPGVLANDDDPDGNSLLAILDGDTMSGTLELQLDGSFIYTPSTGFSGDDLFTYHAYDGAAASTPVTVMLTVLEPPSHFIYLPVLIK
jgi:hypothetical protein